MPDNEQVKSSLGIVFSSTVTKYNVLYITISPPASIFTPISFPVFILKSGMSRNNYLIAKESG